MCDLPLDRVVRNKGKGDAGNEKESESLTRCLKESEGEILKVKTLLHVSLGNSCPLL